MRNRCPGSVFCGIARLNGWDWIINDRGYANVVETGNQTDEAWGLVYSLTAEDESNLDRNEGVPYAYTKEMLKADVCSVETGDAVSSCNGIVNKDSKAPMKSQELLVYVDRKRIKPSKPKTEYIHRMNMGIIDALREGVPASYVDTVLRNYIPTEDIGEDKKKLAEQQALEFNEDDDSE